MKAENMDARQLYDKNLRSYALTLTLHHHLLSSGNEGREIEVVEAGLEKIWGDLTAEQQKEGRGISSDLNWLRRGCENPPRGKKPEDVTAEELAAFDRAVENEDWLSGLQALRVCGVVKPKGLVAGWRGNTYFGLNLPDVSEPFLRAAVGLNKKNSTLGRKCFNLLIHANAASALAEAERIIRDSVEYSPANVANAIAFALDYLGGRPTAFSQDELADKLREAAGRLDKDEESTEEKVMFLSAAGAHLFTFGLLNEAVQLFQKGIDIDPQSPELYGWLGEALYDTEKPRAVDLFEKAIALGARIARPYLHLANHYLVDREFVKARDRAAKASELARDNFSRGYALEILAISLSELGGNSNVVMDLFRRAADLAPANPRIKANMAAYEQFVRQHSSEARWEMAESDAPYETRPRWETDRHMPREMLAT